MESNRPRIRVARAVCAAAAACMGLALGACTTLGAGTGTESPDNAPVSFNWKSSDGGVTGTMSATLPGGKVFDGQYVEITSDTQTEAFFPMYYGWTFGWSDWQPIDTRSYSGNVVANLRGPGAERMRCHFNLNDPRGGMGGGGQGTCQLTDGAIVDAVFPRA